MGVVSTLRRTSFGGLNVLHAAAGGKGLLPMCRYLVEEVRMDVNRRDTAIGKGMTPLQHAASAGNLPTMRYLLDKGADVHRASHVKGQEGFTALHSAAEKGMCEIAKFLLSIGAQVDGESCRVTPLHIAVTGGHDNFMKILLDNHANPNKEVNLLTPVDIAIRTPSLPCLKQLILAGAEVNCICNPLARAAQEGFTEAIKCLLEAGADPNIPNMVQNAVPGMGKGLLSEGAALMLLKDYAKACEILSEGLELDPESHEIDMLYREAMALKNASTAAA